MSDFDAAGFLAMNGQRIITAEEHLGIKGFMLTASVPYRDVLSVQGLWAPPYASTDFLLEVRLCGEKVPTQDWCWNGNECRRRGKLGELRVESCLVTLMHQRGAVLEFTVTNEGMETVTIPVQMVVRGGADCVSFWEFQGPGSTEAGMPWAERAQGWECQGDLLLKRKQDGTLAVGTDLPMTRYEVLAGHWESEIALQPGKAITVHVALTLGPVEVVEDECRALLTEGIRAVPRAREEWTAEVAQALERVPRLEASDERLVAFYNRSLGGLLLNQWRVPDFVTNPYYSTGGINGGCVCCYLWDFGEPWEILALYDPAAVKAHIRQFLTVDITRHFAWVPTTGEAFGPWYPINQEKIIFLIYYYVLLTGDVAFLAENVASRSVLDWVLFNAMYRDCERLPVALIDYGAGNNHLELRGTFRYDHHLPDLNARRYANYLAAHELSVMSGQPAKDLPRRAEDLKSLVRQMMWDPELCWFHHLGPNFEPGLCYTVQMLKLIGSGVLDADQLEGLLSHLNEDEFLSAWGLHSMSKLDSAFDQVDIDNGGGGNYTAFTPQVIERLYKAGQPEMAEDLLQRILWWGERLPYWGDSIVANNMDYRRDTPLQNTIGALAGAQAIIFGMFGVQVDTEGGITVNPQPPGFSPEISLKGLWLRGRVLDIEVRGEEYVVRLDGQETKAKVGTKMTV